ncbi:hypothetical protein ACAG39_09500 [Caldicellulosiruptoraceae bacterium PP1]
MEYVLLNYGVIFLLVTFKSDDKYLNPNYIFGRFIKVLSEIVGISLPSYIENLN